jgi:hypothetical protein
VECGNLAALCTCKVTNMAHGLYDRSQAGTRGQFGSRQQIHPIAHAKVLVGTTCGMAALGLCIQIPSALHVTPAAEWG